MATKPGSKTSGKAIGAPGASSLSPAVRAQKLAEARARRASNPQLSALLGAHAMGGGVNQKTGRITGSDIAGVVTPGISNNQDGLKSMLIAQMNGTGGPSVAEAQFARNTDQAINSTASQIGAAGLNPALAARMTGRMASDMQGQAAQNAGMLRAQEQAQTRSELGNLLSNQATLNLTGQQTNAGIAGDLLKENIRGKYGNQQASTGAWGQVQGARVSSLPALLGLGMGLTSPSNGYGSYGG